MLLFFETFLAAQMVKHLPAMQETWILSLGREDPLEKEMTTHSSTLAWKIPWTQSTGSHTVGHDWATSLTFIQYLKSQSWRKNSKNVRFGILWEELKLQKWYLAGQLSQSGFGEGNDSIKYDIWKVSRYGSYQKELAWKEYLLIWNEESTGFFISQKWEINLRWSLRFYMTDDNVSVIMVMQIIHRDTDRISVKWGELFLF